MAKPKILLGGLFLVAGLLAIVALVSACSGSQGPAGPSGAPGPTGATGPASASTGTLAGTITSSFNKAPVAGATVTLDPPIKDVTITTGADGKYSATLPVGAYTLTIAKTNYTSGTASASVVAGQTTTKDVTLIAAAAVAVSGATQTADPGASVSVKATVAVNDGSTISSYKWTQASGVPAAMSNDTSATLSVTLGAAAAYKAELIKDLTIQNRFGVQAINPESLLSAENAVFKLSVTTSSGTYSGTVTVAANLPYVFSGGIDNVPVNEPVLLRGKTQNAYSWKITLPQGSKATLDDPSAQYPAFTPDVTGTYAVTESNSGASFNVYAGTYVGVITGRDAKTGNPIPSSACTVCHNGKIAPDKFTPWAASGHAEIFTVNIENPAGHWSLSCAECHTVGYDPNAANGGFDEAMAKEKWAVPAHGTPGYYTTMLANYPQTAQLANIQCENCHGPQNSPAHPTGVAARTDISADVCGACHGEPPRHGLYQQWEESKHGDFSLAISESTSSSCARCHTGQGFLDWIQQPDMTKNLQGANGNATTAELAAMGISPDTAQPQTCTVCHDPHAQGTNPTGGGTTSDATVRIEDNTPLLPSGFAATGVGRGAICITCHNTRNGLHNDSVGNPANYQEPHTAAQGDVLLGENAYFVTTGVRSPHSYIQDTCVTCHMEKSPAPADLSMPGSGTNHTFVASPDICSSCHGESVTADTVQGATDAQLQALSSKMTSYLLGKMGAQIHIKDYTAHTYSSKSYDTASGDVTIDKANIVSVGLTSIHGQQGYTLTLKSPVSVTYSPSGETPHTMQLTQVQFQLGSLTTDGKTVVIALSDPLVKAGWNYFLIENDSSEGVHNPGFVNDVLNASIAALR